MTNLFNPEEGTLPENFKKRTISTVKLYWPGESVNLVRAMRGDGTSLDDYSTETIETLSKESRGSWHRLSDVNYFLDYSSLEFMFTQGVVYFEFSV